MTRLLAGSLKLDGPSAFRVLAWRVRIAAVAPAGVTRLVAGDQATKVAEPLT